MPVKSTSPDPKEFSPVSTLLFMVVESVALILIIFPFNVEFPPPTDVLRQPPVGQELSNPSVPVGSMPTLFNLRREEVDAVVPFEAFKLTLAPKVVLDPTVNDELLPTEEFLLTLVPLIDSSSSPETNAGSSTEYACGAIASVKAAIEATEVSPGKYFMIRGNQSEGL